jgi:hypothetical protein
VTANYAIWARWGRWRRCRWQGPAPPDQPGPLRHVVYESGPCGFVLQRGLAALGYHCEVVARVNSVPSCRTPWTRLRDLRS